MTGRELPAPAPAVSLEAKPFWDGTLEERLRLQRCGSCEEVLWYPRGVCPQCGSLALDWFDASGRGVVYSYTVIRRGAPGPYKGTEPYILAYVELDEGPRLLTNLVGCDPSAVQIGSEVGVEFHPTGDAASLVRFRLLT